MFTLFICVIPFSFPCGLALGVLRCFIVKAFGYAWGSQRFPVEPEPLNEAETMPQRPQAAKYGLPHLERMHRTSSAGCFLNRLLGRPNS